MKNCPKCGTETEKMHCDSKNCPWHVCVVCEVQFDHTNVKYVTIWSGRPKK